MVKCFYNIKLGGDNLLTRRERGALYLRLGLRLVLLAVAICAAALLARPAISLLGPFICALIIAWLLNPLIRALNRKLATSRRFLTFIVVFLLLAIVASLLVLLVYRICVEVIDLARNWQTLWDSLQPALDTVEGIFNNFRDYLPASVTTAFDNVGETFSAWIKTTLENYSSSIVSAAGNFASGIASGLIAFIVFIAAAYFVSADYPRIRWKFRQHVGGNSKFAKTLQEATGSALGGYLKAQIILSGTVALIVFAALLIWRQKYALLISLLTGLIDFIPFFGSGIILIPWAVVTLFTGSITKGIFLLALSFVCFLFRKLAEPKVVGNHTGLSSLMSLISIYVGMKVAGVVGMIFMPVVFMVVITMYRVGTFDNCLMDIKTAILDVQKILTIPESERALFEKEKMNKE